MTFLNYFKCLTFLLMVTLWSGCSGDQSESSEEGESHMVKAMFSAEIGKNIHGSVGKSAEELCQITRLQQIQSRYQNELMADSLASKYFSLYRYLNHHAPLLGIGADSFGADGAYTQQVQRLVRELERFWNMTGEIQVLGQHNATLADREALSALVRRVIADLDTQEAIDELVNLYLMVNLHSSYLPESPLLSVEAYATNQNKIVLGDGLIQLFVEAGIDARVAWDAILSHEWSHQVQMKHADLWYDLQSEYSFWEARRNIELEADFFTGYFLTHKRGGTYNWKAVEDFLKMSFEAGDCTTSQPPHGTPDQRMQAAYAGFKLANEAQKKGMISSPDELHQHFVNFVLPEL